MRGKVDWLVLMPGFDLYLWSSRFDGQVPASPWLRDFVSSFRRDDIAAFRIFETQFTHGHRPRGRSVFTSYQMRRQPHTDDWAEPLVSIVNPNNILEIGISPRRLPRCSFVISYCRKYTLRS